MATTLLRSEGRGQLAQGRVALAQLLGWLLMARAASRLSATGSRLSAKLSMPNLRALALPLRRGGGVLRLGLARRNWSARSALWAFSWPTRPAGEPVHRRRAAMAASTLRGRAPVGGGFGCGRHVGEEFKK